GSRLHEARPLTTRDRSAGHRSVRRSGPNSDWSRTAAAWSAASRRTKSSTISRSRSRSSRSIRLIVALNDLQQLSLPVSADHLDTLIRTTERAQRIARLAMSLPTELMAHKERAEASQRAASGSAPVDTGDPFQPSVL